MYLRKCGSQRAEVSFDEPLNTDWDGNELLLSDILGTDGQEIIRPWRTMPTAKCSAPPSPCLANGNGR